MNATRRKCFVSYHHADQPWVDRFVNTFDHGQNLFIARGLGQTMAQDIIDSTDPEYVMRRIRELYIRDSTVTLVMLGRCTWARRYVDWEIQASLRAPQNGLANGLLAIKMPAFPEDGAFPDRLNRNLLTPEKKAAGSDCFARWMAYPQSSDELWQAIEAAFQRRTTHAHLIENPRDRFTYNRQCE
ncbi:MAG: TIR domain-containing protein [Pseudomonadota bacterium]